MIGRTANRWRNWAGNQVAAPRRMEHPASEAELVAAVRRAAAEGLRVKALGSGHSFTGVAVTDGVALALDRYTGIVAADRDSGLVTARAGIPLHRLGEELAARGLAMPNLGDIDRQTLAGAISTGTHGSGLRYGGLAAQVAGLRMVLADGSVVTCSPEQEPELFAAARVGLGALGVISTVTLRCVPAFTLRAVEAPAPYSEVLADLDQLVESNDHVDVHWLPHTDRALVKRNNRTPETPRPPSRLTAWWNDEFSQNTAFHAACRAGRRWPSLVPQLNWIIAGAIGSREYTDRSDRVFTSPRRVRFYEMEYAVPRGDLRGVLGELAAFIDSSGLAVSFPVEVRVAAADDIWLSTAYGRESGYIAVHVFEGTPYEEYFRGVAAIMDDVGGRPHWGKLHFQTAATLRDRYPRFADFVALRDRLDPDRRFANPYLDRVLGP